MNIIIQIFIIHCTYFSIGILFYRLRSCYIIVLKSVYCLFTASREAAYMYAVISAGVTYALMDACSRGNISICGCDAHYPSALEDGPAASAWKWGGCSVDLGFGMGFARKFLDAQESDAGDSRSLMNLHNNKAGRKVYNNNSNNDNNIIQLHVMILNYNSTTAVTYIIIPG